MSQQPTLAACQARENLFYDVTRVISSRTPVYPGDPAFGQEILSSVDAGECCTLSKISMSNHLGTHIDFPAHVIKNGKTRSDYTLEDLMGRCAVVEIALSVSVIEPQHFASCMIHAGDIVFFKTRHSFEAEVYHPNYTVLSPEAAQQLKALGVKIVGMDGMSVDVADSHELSVHHLLLEADILIVENLMLKDVPAGVWYARINPLPIVGIDGVQVVVSLESL